MREDEKPEQGREIQFIGVSTDFLKNGKIYIIKKVLVAGAVEIEIDNKNISIDKIKYHLIRKF